ncbi:diaminopimelate epimerase [Filimonas effusa]|uniref:Diaminopimelate epimerase n=1 Tax=Filimonas effusa TaxID=2508721 RepID=A0A4Q1D990_9BACT|nr:diaminopimelate epimerase [Filimonas effusa]RXK85937.1 diaminopimelate epimerase [Filimonas effusa]
MDIHFFKYQGTGNDFIIIDNRDGKVHFSTEQVKHMCDRRFGIGADGLMLLNTREGYDFEMKYYNADGRESTMCGNGGRCLVKFAHHRGISRNKYHFIAIDGPHDATIEDNRWVHLKMKDVDGLQHNYTDTILNTGSPHYVKPVSDIRHYDVVGEGKAIRYNETYAQEGINVNFVEEQAKGIYVRTYERGVEDETLSCGTGVTASALVFAHNENGFNRVEIQTPGGRLAVEFEKKGEAQFENIWLCGPANFVFSGTINID